MAGLGVLGLRQPKIEIVDGETLQSSRRDRGSIMPLREDILSYREMCDSENIQTLQRKMNFRINPSYYEGHDVPKRSYNQNPKHEDQPEKLPCGRLTQNGLFAQAVNKHKNEGSPPELVKVYEKVLPGVWSLKGYFDLVDYKIVHDGKRNVFRYIYDCRIASAPQR